MSSDLLPPQVQALVDAEIAPGERVLWQAQPLPSGFARGGICLTLFGIPFTGFAVFWIVMASGATHIGVWGFLFPLFGLPFLLAGLGMLSAPLWMRWQAGRTAYVLTDRRAVILSPGLFSRSVRTFEPERLGHLQRRERADGSGDLVFETQHWRDSDGDRRTREVGFIAVPEVKLVEQMVRALVATRRQD